MTLSSIRSALRPSIWPQHLTEGHYLKRAATLLFHSDPEKFTTGACIKIGFFRTDSDLLYHDVIEGDLLTQAEKTIDVLLTKYLRAGISYQGTQRLERFPVPEPALREALINAIAHKDYGALIPTQISVYDHKLIIWNAGQLPPDWSLVQSAESSQDNRVTAFSYSKSN